MTLKELLSRRAEREAELARAKESLAEVEAAIDAAVAETAAQARKLSGKDTGAVNFVLDGFEVKQTVQKTVKWDQAGLAGIYDRIAAGGDDPADYIKREYSVSESAFKKWPGEVKAVFVPARSVVPGKPKYEFKAVEQ